MAKMSLVTKITDDGQSACIEMHMDGTPLGHIFLEAAEIEGLIENLAETRARLPDEVPRERDPGTRALAIADPVWRTIYRSDMKSVLLGLRHPGLGWTSWLMPDREARNLARWILENCPEE